MLEGIARIEINGMQIPSDCTILIILIELKTTEKRSNFLDTSDVVVGQMKTIFDPNFADCSEFAQMGLKYKINYQTQCELVDVNFPALWYYFASSFWFISVMGYLEIPNQSDMSKDIVKYVNTFKKTGEYVRDNKYVDDRHNLIRFKEYREAISPIGQFISTTGELSKTNQRMKELLIERDNILKELAKWDSFNPVRICQFCNSIFDVRTSPDKWKSCGSPKCVKAYSAATTKKSRQQPSAQNKSSQTAQFVKIDDTPHVCQGCGCRRIVNVENRCKPCQMEMR